MADKRPTQTTPTPSLSELVAQQNPEALQQLSLTLAEATRESQALMSEFLDFSRRAGPTAIDPISLHATKSFASIGQALLGHPERVFKAQMELWEGYVGLWQDMLMGSGTPPRDRRFADPEWAQNPMFRMMQKSYELNTKWMLSLIDAASEAPSEDRRKARFFTQQTIDAMAPTNFFATNPAALRAFVESRGQSVIDGIRQAREDLRKSEGRVSISQVDTEPFEVGQNVATTPGKVIFRNDLIELLQFEPTEAKAYAKPLLIFPPWINKFYILDLREENSMIRWLLSKGYTLFLVSWRSADDTTKDYTWDDYAREGIYAAIEETLKVTGTDDLNTVGYCIGGTLLSTVLAKMAKDGDERVNSVTYFASQCDFEEAGELKVFSDDAALDHIRTIIEANGGIMPGEVMGETFNYLRPIDLVWRYVVDNYMLGRKPKPFDLLYWNADQTNIPGATHIEYLARLYRDNAFSQGQFELLGRKVGASDITTPSFVQASRADHIVPFNSTYRGARKFSGDTTFCLAGSGHIAGVVNHPHAKKYQHWVNPGAKSLPDSVDDWLAGAEEIQGSWWPTWHDWLKKRSGKKVDALKPKGKRLGNAPGTYVRRRLEDIAAERKRG